VSDVKQSTSDDKLDERTWDVVRAMVLAAHEVDRDAYRASAVRMDELKQADATPAGRYLFYLLWRRADQLMKKPQPTLSDIANLADLAYPKFSQLANADKITLEHILRSAFGKSDFSKSIDAATFAIYMSTALASLLDEAGEELDAMRPYLASWNARKYGSK